jgi:Spy/CpxP family protein refolding chaperone
MESSTNSQSKARLIVVSVFVIGFAAGALSLNLYQQLNPSSKREGPRGGAEVLIKMKDEVGLAADQEEQIKKILDETREKYRSVREEMDPAIKQFEPRFNAVRQESRDRIRALLTPEQLPKYEKLVQNHDKLREQEREQRERSKK